MDITVRIPLSLEKFTGNKTEFECQGETVEKLLANLNSEYPGIKENLYDEEGKFRPSFSLFVNGRIVRSFKTKKLLLKEGDEILIMQLVAGG